LAQAPALVTPPQSQVVAAGTTVTMGVAVSGSSPLTYQWLFNGEAINDGSQIAGSQSNLLTLDNVTLGNSGNYQLVVTNAYGSTNASATLTVLRKTPLITWSNPTPITYGAPLTPAQLNATAMVPGAFAYNPATGTVLNAGTTTLSLLFTPADTVDYSGSIDTVSMVVLPEPLTVSANNAVRAYGQPNPALTGVITGLANGDNITATYSVTANPGSPVGKYPILPSLVDPNNRQINYAVSLVNGTLTVATPPAILSASQFGNSFVFTWSTTAFQTYQIQYATNLNQGTWVNLGEAITATNSTATASGSTANAQEFYRVVVLP